MPTAPGPASKGDTVRGTIDTPSIAKGTQTELCSWLPSWVGLFPLTQPIMQGSWRKCQKTRPNTAVGFTQMICWWLRMPSSVQILAIVDWRLCACQQ